MILYLITLFICLITYTITKLFLNVDYKTKKNGGDIVANILKSHNIKFIFTLTGGHISPILSGCKKIGINVIDVRNEATAAFAADGVSRLSNQIGVAIVTAGPGITNTITAIRNAQMAESPLLLIGGAAANLLKGRGSLQDVEQLQLLKPICKKVYTCTRICQIKAVINDAIYEAKSGTMGPVFVELPIDLLYDIQTIYKNSGLEKPKKTLFSKIADLYISLQIRYMFSNAWNKSYDLAPKQIKISKISNSNIKSSINLINNSNKPIIVLGSQSVSNTNNINEMVENLKKLNIPIYLSSSSRGVLSDEFDLQFYHNRSKALREADLILLLGISCDFRLDYGRVLNKKAKIIMVNINKQALKLNQPIFWKATLNILGDSMNFINQLNLNYSSKDEKIYSTWITHLEEREIQKNNTIKEMSEIKSNKINPIKLCMRINELIKKETIIIVDGGDFAATAAYTIKPKGPLQWMDPGPFGTLGVGAGFALAAKLCYPEKDVIIIYGDGAAGYSLIEYDTFKRHNLNIISIIGNDACWSQILREQIEILKDDVACNLEYSDYQKIGESFNCKGYLLKNDSDLDKLPNILNNINQPTIINCLISKTDFRKGSLSV